MTLPSDRAASSASRREFLRSAAIGVGAWCAGGMLIPAASGAVKPPQRVRSRITGLSLTAYSLKPHMRWFWGKETGGKMDTLGFLDYSAEMGLEGAELTSYFFPEPLPLAEINQIKRRSHLLGIDISAGAMGNNFGHPPGSDVAKKEMAYFRTWIDRFADMGAPAVRVFASKSLPAGATDEQVLANVVANLQEALPYAEQKGVMLGLENHDFVKRIDYLLHVLGKIDSPWLGVIWDSANLAPTPDPYAELAKIAPYAIVAQVKVMTKVNGENVPADYGRLIRILHEAKYAGYLVFEYEEPEDPFKAIPPHLAELRKLLAAK